MAFLRNTWYVAAWDHEIDVTGLLPRTLCNEPVVLYRDAQGQPHALQDRCPHRFAPLHKGRRHGDVIECGYHGLRFNTGGQCVLNPHATGHIPPGAKVRVFPVVERYSLVWIWMGDPAAADAALIPDFHFMDPAEWEVGKGYLHANAGYQLEVDNIMDLSHIEFLHPTTLGSGGISAADVVTTREGDLIWARREIRNHLLSDFLYEATGITRGTLVDRWIEVRWSAPSNMALFLGSTPAGRPRTEGSSNTQAHLFTPETERTTHYWFGISFPKSMGPRAAEMARKRIQGLRQPFETEDLPMIEAQQLRMGDADFWSLKPVLLASDAAAVQARRALEQLIAKEQS
jgi:phenylpropionate dioxygenase-like ring-hydroxylating dioxygenase large terminal subunit